MSQKVVHISSALDMSIGRKIYHNADIFGMIQAEYSLTGEACKNVFDTILVIIISVKLYGRDFSAFSCREKALG